MATAPDVLLPKSNVLNRSLGSAGSSRVDDDRRSERSQSFCILCSNREERYEAGNPSKMWFTCYVLLTQGLNSNYCLSNDSLELSMENAMLNHSAIFSFIVSGILVSLRCRNIERMVDMATRSELSGLTSEIAASTCHQHSQATAMSTIYSGFT